MSAPLPEAEAKTAMAENVLHAQRRRQRVHSLATRPVGTISGHNKRIKINKSQTTPAIAARLKAGLTLQQAARRARLSAPYLRRIERGQFIPGYSTALRLTHIYGQGCSIGIFLNQQRRAVGTPVHIANADRKTALALAHSGKAHASGQPLSPSQRDSGRARRIEVSSHVEEITAE